MKELSRDKFDQLAGEIIGEASTLMLGSAAFNTKRALELRAKLLEDYDARAIQVEKLLLPLRVYAQIDESRWSLFKVWLFNMRIGNWARTAIAEFDGEGE